MESEKCTINILMDNKYCANNTLMDRKILIYCNFNTL